MNIPPHIQQAIQAYYAERATEDDLAALESWLREDQAHVRLFAELGMVEWQMLCELEKADTAAVLSMLREAEENAEPDYSLLPKPAQASPAKPDQPPITAREFFSIAGYLAGKALRTKAGINIATAAVLLIAGMLFFTILVPPSDRISQPITTTTPNEPGRPGPAQTSSPVATLTNTHNATWAPGPAASAARETARTTHSDLPPTPGTPLHPGTRLTLTEGFAEITTNRGAIAVIEAPATIELTDSDNAIRLHAGKMVGICETASSKGFVVRTPHMDVTDLGTRFGVDASQPDATEVHVFDGMVQANHLVSAQTRRIGSGQSVSSTATGAGFVPIRYSTAQFAAVALDGSLNRAVLNGDVPEFLGVVDLIAGGDGTSGRSPVGLDPVTGRFVNAQTPGVWQERNSDGRFQPVNDSAFIAGTFTPKNNGSVDGLPDGLTLPSIPQNSAMVYGAIWCGGDYPETTKSAYSAVISGIDYTAGDRRALYLHSGCGVTLDLKAIRSAYPNHRVTRFVATANNTTQPDQVGVIRRSQIIVGLDDLAVVDHPFVVVPTAASQPLEIDIEIQDARYLTLISIDGGDGIVLDRIVFGNPRLILEPINQ